MASPLISGRPYKRRNGAQVFGLLLLTALYSASPLPVSRAVPQPAKSETGETSELAIENLLEPIRVKYHLPALGGAVIGPSGPIGVRAVGIRKFGDPTRVTSNDSFHLGSCSKAMTATLAGILVEERNCAGPPPFCRLFQNWRRK